ncbi:DUF6194 family protein [Micromonospora sp. WMMD1120]|uniref:DUF6194 family protein n=1 Tax=Micromonospora sp. WMMD1120 TaxID=3016106 RepID=UPI0024169462|nr:DUF6194 family protein [Micromonospora sp. WMMD1120]MDG4805778.1 DUF6194 family protein [Micromonospora sp. WMMD1120]
MTSLDDLLAGSPTVLAIGEPTHGESAFLQVRNETFLTLAERGYRSIALESDRAAGLLADAFAQGADVPLDTALAEGFSHAFGTAPANRDLLVRMREWNAGRPVADRLRFHGFDAPLELESVPSPRRHLVRVGDFLGLDLAAEIDDLVGDETRWSDPAAVWEPGRSVGRSADAQRLRVLADDLLGELYRQAPERATGWSAAFVQVTSAIALLRYHSVAAAAPPSRAERFARLAGARGALMAENLLAIRAAEAHRGPTLVFAHNSHLQRHPSTMTVDGTRLTWSGAGAIVGSLLGERYRVVAGSIGVSPALGIGEPAPASYEGRLQRHGELPVYVRTADIPPAEGREHDYRYAPLNQATVAHVDAVLHVPTGVDAAMLAERLLALPGVEQVVASEEIGSPEGAWGDRFFYVGTDRRQPFATIVEHDVPGFDEESRLDRPGVFRLNLDLGRAEFERRFGFPPKDFEAHRGSFDFARLDTVLPHPSYALYGFGCVVMPGPLLLPEVDRLLAVAHGRAVDRHERAARRSADGRG